MTIDNDSVAIGAILISFGAGAWATAMTHQVVMLQREVRTIRRDFKAFLDRMETVAPYLARGERASDRSTS